METNRSAAGLSVGLAILSVVLGLVAPGLLLADFGPPLALRILFAALPLILIPFLIGWLTPEIWWIAGVGAAGLVLLAVVALASAPPQSLGELWVRLPLLLPLLCTLAFAFLGRVLRRRKLRKKA